MLDIMRLQDIPTVWVRGAILWLSGMLVIGGWPAHPAEDSATEMLAMVMDLLRSPDRDTRGLALQQVREGLPGKAATTELARALPTLAPENEAALIEALADRADPAARDGIRAAVESTNLVVRVSAIRALGRLGQSEDVPRLAALAASRAAVEHEAACLALARLPGAGVNAALLSALEQGDPAAQVELFPVLAARGVTNAASAVLIFARVSEPQVRHAAIKASQSLASSRDLAALIQILNDAASDTERDLGESALLAVVRREPAASLAPVLAAIPTAVSGAQVCLLRALAAIGGVPALQAMVDATQSFSGAVQAEAVRLLAEWPDPAAVPALLQVVEKAAHPLYRTLAFRGLVRLVGNTEGRGADVAQLEKIWRLATDADERRLVLGSLTTISQPSSGAVLLAARGLEDAAVRSEAVLAVANLAGKLKTPDLASIQPALVQAWEFAHTPELRKQLEVLRAAAGHP